MSQQIKNKARYEKILLRLGTLGFSIEDVDDGDTVWFKPTFYVKAPNGKKVKCQFKYNIEYDEFFVDGYYYHTLEYDENEVTTGIPTIKTMTDKLATYGFHDLYVDDWNDQNTLIYINDLRREDACSHDDLQIKTMELSNNELLLLTIDCNACGKRISTSAPMESDAWEAEDLNTWAKQELSSHGQNVSFKNWAKKEVKSHGNIDLVDWAKHEKQSHTKKYGAEYENIGTMQSSPASGYNGYMNMMSSARRLVEIGNETGLDQKLGEAYQDESGRWFLPILERKASESFSLDSKKADSINMEEPVIEEPSFIPDGDGRAIGQQNSSINLSPLHAESGFVDIDYEAKIRLNNGDDRQYITPSIEEGMAFEEGEGVLSSSARVNMNAETFNADIDYSGSKYRSAIVALHEALYDVVDGKPMTEADIEGLEASHPIIVDAVMRGSNAESFNAEAIGNEIGCDKCGRFAKLWSYANFDLDLCAICSKKEGFRAESDKLHGWATTMLRDVKDLIEDLENGAVYDLDDCRERLEKLRDDTSHLNAETEAATYSPSSNPDMVNEIQTSPTNESPQLFNASNTFNTTTTLGIGGLVVAALSLPMLYSSAKSRLGKSAEEKRKASGSVRKNHTQVKNSEYSVGQVNPVEAEGQQDIHGAEGITNPRHIPSPTPSGYPSKNLKMW